MFNQKNFFNQIGAPGLLITIIGISFLLLGVLIMAFPELLAYLVGGFLIFDGIILLGLGLQTRKFENNFHRQKGEKIWDYFDSF